MNSTDPSARPVNESTPPKKATTTPSGVMSPISTPPTSSAAPVTRSTQAATCLLGLPDTSSWVRSTEPPSACSGVTERTRREPAQAAAQVVSATPTAGSTTKGCAREKSAGALSISCAPTCTPTAASRSPTTSPMAAPSRPTTSPWRPTCARCERAVAPIRRSSAMRRVRPAMMVENVFAVTIAATYIATTVSSTDRRATTNASVSLSPMNGSACSTVPM